MDEIWFSVKKKNKNKNKKENIPLAIRWTLDYKIRAPCQLEPTTKQNTARNFKWIFGQSCSPNIEIRQPDDNARTTLVDDNMWLTERNSIIWKQRTCLITQTEVVLFALCSEWVPQNRKSISAEWRQSARTYLL